MVESAPEMSTIIVRAAKLTVTWRDFIHHCMPVLTYTGQTRLMAQPLRPVPAVVVFRERWSLRQPGKFVGDLGSGTMPSPEDDKLSAVALYDKGVVRQIMAIASLRGSLGTTITLKIQPSDELRFTVLDCTINEDFDLATPTPWPFPDVV